MANEQGVPPLVCRSQSAGRSPLYEKDLGADEPYNSRQHQIRAQPHDFPLRWEDISSNCQPRHDIARHHAARSIQRSNSRMSPPALVSSFFEPHQPHRPRKITLLSAVSAVTSFRPPAPTQSVTVRAPSRTFFSDRLGKHAVPGYQVVLAGGPADVPSESSRLRHGTSA